MNGYLPRIAGHILEAKRIAQAVLRAPDKFSQQQKKIAARVMFWVARDPARVRQDAEIQDALEGMHDLALELALL